MNPSPFQVPVSSLPALSGPNYGAGYQQPNPNAQPNNAQPVMNSNGQATGFTDGTTLPSTGTLTANISNPITSTRPAPVVMTSNAASDDLASKQAQFNQLQTDTANHQAAVNGSNVAPNSSSNSSGNGQNDTSAPQGTPPANPGQNGSNSTSAATTGASLDDQINGLLSSLSSNTDAINTNEQSKLDPITSQMNETQTTMDQGFAATAEKLNAIATGTYPLSPTESSLLSSTTSLFSQTIKAQQTANTAYTGQMVEAMASLGISPSMGEAIGNIQAAIDSGNDKVSTLNANMAQSLAQLQQGFQTQDYKMVQDSWTDTSNYLNQRMSTLSSMQNTVLTQAQQQKTDLQTFTTTNLSAIMQSANYDQTAKENMIKDAFTQQQINETQRKDLVDEANSAESNRIAAMNAQKGSYSMTSTGDILDTRTGQVVGQQENDASTDSSVIGHTGNPIVDANTKTSPDGVPYVDGTNLTGALADQAQMTAAKNGIPYLGKDAATGLGQAAAVQDSLKSLQDQLSKVNASSYLTRPFVQAANAIGGADQANATIAAIGSYKAVAIPLLKALSNGASGFRITQAELNQASSQYLPEPNDTVQVVQQKIDNINQILSNGEKGIFGDETYTKFHPDSETAPITNSLNSLMSTGGASGLSPSQSNVSSLSTYQSI